MIKTELVETKNISRPKGTYTEFEQLQWVCNKPMPVVKPGNQRRRFTHIDDTIDACIFAWKKNKSTHYSISNKKSYTIEQVAKLFSNKIKYLPKRPGERFASALTKMSLSNEVIQKFGKKSLKKYVENFKLDFIIKQK